MSLTAKELVMPESGQKENVIFSRFLFNMNKRDHS
jgi:hypothetical protein